MDVIVQCALCESTCDRRKAHHYHELDFESTVFVKKEVVENELANKYGPRTLSDTSRGTEPTTIARWSLIPEGESRFCQKAAAKATRPDHHHASLPRRICTDHAQSSATTVVMVRHAAPGSKADLYFPGAQAASPVRLVGIRIDSDPTILRPRPKWATRSKGSIVSRDMGTPPPSKE